MDFFEEQYLKLGIFEPAEPKYAQKQAQRSHLPTHRWTLEELWSFTLKLERLEKLLGTEPPPAPEKPNAPDVGIIMDISMTPDMPYSGDIPKIDDILPINVNSALDETPPMPEIPEVSPVPAPYTPKKPQPAQKPNALPQGRTPEETFKEAMQLVERGAVSPKPPRSTASKVILALIAIGVVALIALGVYHFINAKGL